MVTANKIGAITFFLKTITSLFFFFVIFLRAVIIAPA